MKTLLLRLFAAVCLAQLVSGCASLDVAAPGNADRVLRGTVSAPSALPAGAVVVVRLVDALGAAISRGDVPLADRPTAVPVERVLGEFRQTLTAMRSEPLPFEIAYRAEDAELRRGLNVDVRITFGGRMHFRTISAHVLTLASSPFPQDVAVQPLN
jgi:uncharacterized lipoprotein YbaY